MMKTLFPIPTVVLGAASASFQPAASLAPDGSRWCAAWADPAGISMEATAPLGGGGWSPARAAAARLVPRKAGADGGRSAFEGALVSAGHPPGIVALRSGCRHPGVPPRFPSATLLVSRKVDDRWVDLAYADDPPGHELLAAALGTAGDNVLAVYLVANRQGEVTCRAFHLPAAATTSRATSWQSLPDYPLAPGVAGVLAGMHDDVVIAAGGANFPGSPPWEGGAKRTYDEIFVLQPGAGAWRPAGHLPEPRAYAATVSVPGGILVTGGENGTGIFRDSLLLRWDGRKVAVEPAGVLPAPLAHPMGVCLDGRVYLAGGYGEGTPRVPAHGFYCLELADSAAGWKQLPAWPGPGRAQGVMAALDGAVYLISGLGRDVGAAGEPRAVHLSDAYRYRPGDGWERLPDLPWSTLAAPSPAPVTTWPPRVFVLGGVDGRQAGKLPRDTRVPEDILYFDVTRHDWYLWPERWPEPVVSTPTVAAAGRWIFVSGETMAGKRTAAVLSWQPGSLRSVASASL